MKETIANSIFGTFDGLTSVLGVIVALLVAGHAAALLGPVVGLAIASGVGMGAGEYLSDEDLSKPQAAVMGLATLVGVLLPAVPFVLLSGTAALLTGASVAVALGVLISELRKRQGVAHKMAYLQTFGILLTVAVLTVIVTILLPGSSG